MLARDVQQVRRGEVVRLVRQVDFAHGEHVHHHRHLVVRYAARDPHRGVVRGVRREVHDPPLFRVPDQKRLRAALETPRRAVETVLVRQRAHQPNRAPRRRAPLHGDARELVDAKQRFAAGSRRFRDEATATRALADRELLLVDDPVVALVVPERAVDLVDEADGLRARRVRGNGGARRVRGPPGVPDEPGVVLEVGPHRPLRARLVGRAGDVRQTRVGVALAVVAVRHQHGAVERGALADQERAARVRDGDARGEEDQDGERHRGARGARRTRAAGGFEREAGGTAARLGRGAIAGVACHLGSNGWRSPEGVRGRAGLVSRRLVASFPRSSA